MSLIPEKEYTPLHSSVSKPLYWVGSSKRDLLSLPLTVRKFFGHALDFAQRGEHHDSAKPLKGFGDAAVVELIERDSAGTYRAIYTVRFADAVFVLHCFQKKSIRGIATPKQEIDVVRARLKAAELLAKELRRGKTSN